MGGILRCKCARRERGCASWRFPSTIVGGAAAIPKWRGALLELYGQVRASSRRSPEFPSRKAGARAIIVCQADVRLTAKFRPFPRKRESTPTIGVPAFAGISARGLSTAVFALASLMVLAAATAAGAQTAVD